MSNSQPVIDLYVPTTISTNSYVSIKNTDFDDSFDLTYDIPLETTNFSSWCYGDNELISFNKNTGVFSFNLTYKDFYNLAHHIPNGGSADDNVAVTTFKYFVHRTSNPLLNKDEKELSIRDLSQRYLVWKLLGSDETVEIDNDILISVINPSNTFNDYLMTV